MATKFLTDLAAARFSAKQPSSQAVGITSVCSAHRQVIAAALSLGRATGKFVLIEATCNQVNQEGGYTGMRPADFRRYVEGIAAQVGFDLQYLILGGDHLGPNPWKGFSADLAMDKACQMVAAYAEAGFSKIHLDASMACADDPVPLPEAVIAARATRLAVVAERHAAHEKPVYVIGTEVPVPGGALETVDYLQVTTPNAARTTVALHREAFAKAGIIAAFDRVIGLVVQPGVEFGNENVVAYDPIAAKALVSVSGELPMVFEAHSTDYQTPQALAALVKDGFAILKVGPGLTFALREALYSLDYIADHLFPARDRSLRETMEQVMLDQPQHWESHYPGTSAHQKLQRHFSYSDRIRYYWTVDRAEKAVAQLLALFGNAPIPAPLIAQFLGGVYSDVMSGAVAPTAPAILLASVTRVLAQYDHACDG